MLSDQSQCQIIPTNSMHDITCRQDTISIGIIIKKPLDDMSGVSTKIVTQGFEAINLILKKVNSWVNHN